MRNTLVVALAALKQSELAGVVDHGELFQQGLDDFASGRAGADVQVLGRVFGQVEGGAPLHTAALPGAGGVLRTAASGFLRVHDRHGPRQLELNFDEAGVGTVLVLCTGTNHSNCGTILTLIHRGDVKNKSTHTRSLSFLCTKPVKNLFRKRRFRGISESGMSSYPKWRRLSIMGSCSRRGQDGARD